MDHPTYSGQRSGSQCPKCGRYNGGHDFECEFITIERLRDTLRSYMDGKKRDQGRIEHLERQISIARQQGQSFATEALRKAEQQTQFWHGKYAIVKTENNALRKAAGSARRKG